MTDEGLVALLRSDATLAGLVGNRIMPVLLAEGSDLPALTFQVVGGSSALMFDGPGIQKTRYQFDAHGMKHADTAAVQRALRKLLEGYEGTLVDGTFVQLCEYIQPIDYYDGDSRQFRQGSEFYFYFTLP